MERWGQDSRKEAVITDIDVIVPKDHLLRKLENVMDYEWIYQRMKPYYCHDNGRPGTDPVVLIKMVLIQHRPGLRNVRRGVGRRLQDTLDCKEDPGGRADPYSSFPRLYPAANFVVL